jgi:hypothetical protein
LWEKETLERQLLGDTINQSISKKT